MKASEALSINPRPTRARAGRGNPVQPSPAFTPPAALYGRHVMPRLQTGPRRNLKVREQYP